MATVNIFDDSIDESPHPRLRFWNELIRSGKIAKLEIYRPAATIGMFQPKMFVHFYQDEKEVKLDEADWEQVLNEGLIALKVPATDKDNESQRFGLGLRDSLGTVEKEYGNGYFNAVLLDLIYESEINREEVIADVLQHTYRSHVEGGRSYDHCRESIALGISGRARELTLKLGYSPQDMKEILTKAIATYLDDRFSVSNRRRLGLL